MKFTVITRSNHFKHTNTYLPVYDEQATRQNQYAGVLQNYIGKDLL
jgi:hypothetical protein